MLGKELFECRSTIYRITIRVKNRSQESTLFPLIQSVDWNYSSFTTGDKSILAQIGHIWGQQTTGANPADITAPPGQPVTPIGAYNSSLIISSNTGQSQWGANNYSLGNFQLMTALGLMLILPTIPLFPPVPLPQPPSVRDGWAKTVGAYAVYAVKGWLTASTRSSRSAYRRF